MYNNYYKMTTEKRPVWRSAYEIKIAALEHEKRRFQMMHEYTALVKPQAQPGKGQPTDWSALFKAPLRLLANLMG